MAPIDRPLYAGVELGGTKCVAILATGPDEIVARETVPTTIAGRDARPRSSDILSRWRSQQGFAALGIGSFGPLDLDPASPDLSGRSRARPSPAGAAPTCSGGSERRLASRRRSTPTSTARRWPRCAGGQGRGFDDFAYITVGTGVGVGLIVNGKPTRGFAHCELGHIRVARLPGDEFAGSCPFHGDCVEGLAAGPSLKARAGDAAHQLGPDDPVWESVAWALAQLCHAIVCAAAPRAIAIGGGVVENQPHLLERIERMLIESLNGYMQLPPGGALRPRARARRECRPARARSHSL